MCSRMTSIPRSFWASTLKKAEWNNSTILNGDLTEEITRLKKKLKGNIVVHGSARLVQTLVANDLMDELRLMVFPVILGSGKKLFTEMNHKKTMKLISSQSVGDGVQILIYEPTQG